MASKYVEETILAFLQDNWTTTPVLTENLQGQAPEDGSAYIVVQFPIARTERLSTGTRRYKEEGGFRLLIQVPRGGGVEDLRNWGEQLTEMFRDQRIGDVRCMVPSEPFTGDQSDDDTYWSASIVVPFWWSFQG